MSAVTPMDMPELGEGVDTFIIEAEAGMTEVEATLARADAIFSRVHTLMDGDKRPESPTSTVSDNFDDLPPTYQEVTKKREGVQHTSAFTPQSSPQGVKNIEIRPLPAVRAIDIDTSVDVPEYRCTPCSCISSGILFGILLGAEIFCLLTHRLNPLGWLLVVCLLTYFLREQFFRIVAKKFFSRLFSRRQVPTVNHV